MTAEHPSTATLMDWLEGRLSEEQAGQLTAQLAALAAAGDDSMAQQMAQLRAFLALRNDLNPIRPLPADAVAALRSQFNDFAQTRRKPSSIERFVAQLVSNAAGTPGMAGVRGAAAQGGSAQNSGRHLMYFTRVADVLLDIQKRPGMDGLLFYLQGQIMPNVDTKAGAFDGCSVQLLRDGFEKSLRVADKLGEFRFEAMPPGSYELIISAERIEIEVAPIDL